MKWTRIRLLLAIVVAALLVGAVAGGLYFELGQGPEPGTLATVEDDPEVTVERTDPGYLVRSGPVTESTTGGVLYPGARVEPASYVPTAAEI
ncbi:MAG: alpha/beta hydrolase, partial [Haloferacaceae archaeon]